MLEFVISEAGAVTDIGVGSGELPAEVLDCAVKELEALRFPPPKGGPVRWQMGFPVYEWR